MLLVMGLGGRVELASWLSDTDVPELHFKAEADGVCVCVSHLWTGKG